MIDPIVCMTCGFPLGDIAGLFRHMRAEVLGRLADSQGVPVHRLDATRTQADCSEIFEILDVPGLCCRAHLCSNQLIVHSL